jgi:GT2 family glycosyltransferase
MAYNKTTGNAVTHISIIIVHYNTTADTDECLLSLQKLRHPGFALSTIIVDNGSRAEYVLPKGVDPRTNMIIRSEANLGFTGGNNLGMYQAIERFNSEFVLLLNSDTIVDHRFLAELVKAMEADSRIGMCSPKIYFYPKREFHNEYDRADRGKILWYAGGSIDWRNLLTFHRGVDEVDRGQFDTPTPLDFATGCCVLIRREVLEKIGVFDKRFFLYFEDVDLSLRTLKAGYELAFVPRSIVWHKNAGSSGGSGSSLQSYYQMRNRLYFVYKHGSWRARLLALRVALQGLLGTTYERTAVFHALTGQFGKQPIL